MEVDGNDSNQAEVKTLLETSAKSAGVTVIILTKNEEANLAGCLQTVVRIANEILIVDSGSTDGTLELAERLGAKTISHPFHTHSTQWKWALENLPITTDWVLGLDADQRLTPELAEEVREFLSRPAERIAEISGCYINRRQVFRGKWIKHGGYYPKYLLKLFRPSRVELDHNDMVDHHFRVTGKTIKLRHDLIEDNRNEADIAVWIEKHNRYSTLQALEEFELSRNSQGLMRTGSFLGMPDERTQRLKAVWRRLPLYIRPFLYFGYRYFFRLGFLDAKQGFIFHFLQAFWYRLLVDIKLDELRHSVKASERSSRAISTAPEIEPMAEGANTVRNV